MRLRSWRFELEAPDGWEAQQGDGRLSLHGPNGEELILSGTVVSGSGPTENAESVTRQLLENAKKGIREAAAHPDLEPLWDVKPDHTIDHVECWSAHAQTKDHSTMFAQAAVVGGCAVMLITFEAPNRADELDLFTRFLRSIRPAPTD